MLSLKEGDPIAKVCNSKTLKKKDGKYKYLGIIDPDNIDNTDARLNLGYDIDPYQLINEDDIEKKIRSKKPNKVRKAIRETITKGKISKVGKEFILNDGYLEPVPDITKEREVIYISGPSGVGKSTWISSYIMNYLDIFPKADVVLFSCVDNDPAFNNIRKTGRLKTVKLDSDYLEDVNNNNGIKIDDLANRAVIFDDIDVITNKKIKQDITDLREKCLQIGRHKNITILSTTHVLCNFNQTRVLIEESHKVVLFPRGGSTHQITRFLNVYCGLDKKEIVKFLNVPSRWALIQRSYPKYVLYRDGAYVL